MPLVEHSLCQLLVWVCPCAMEKPKILSLWTEGHWALRGRVLTLSSLYLLPPHLRMEKLKIMQVHVIFGALLKIMFLVVDNIIASVLWPPSGLNWALQLEI